MADESSKRRKPRIRKAAPTVRQQVEAATKQAEAEPKKKRTRGVFSKIGRPFAILFGFLGKILKPLAPIGRFLRKILNWLVPRYFINSWREVKQVTWPSRKETWRLTGAVFVFALVFGALVAGVDKGLDEFFKKVILKH